MTHLQSLFHVYLKRWGALALSLTLLITSGCDLTSARWGEISWSIDRLFSNAEHTEFSIDIRLTGQCDSGGDECTMPVPTRHIWQLTDNAGTTYAPIQEEVLRTYINSVSVRYTFAGDVSTMESLKLEGILDVAGARVTMNETWTSSQLPQWTTLGPALVDITELELRRDDFIVAGDSSFTITEINDGRCPEDVACYWPGAVTLNGEISKAGTSTPFSWQLLNQADATLQYKIGDANEWTDGTFPFEDFVLLLMDVEPYPTEKNPVPYSDYILHVVVGRPLE